MVKLSTEAGDLIIHIQGWSKLWALKRRLRVPLTAIEEVRGVSSPAIGWWRVARSWSPYTRCLRQALSMALPVGSSGMSAGGMRLWKFA